MRIQLKDLSPKAVAIGAVADLVLTNVLLLPVVIITDVRAAQTAPGARIAAGSFAHALATNKALYLLAMVLGSVASILAGWIAARVARRAEILNGAASALACVGLGVYALIRYPKAAPWWEHIAFFILAPVLGALGGFVWRRRSERARPAATPAFVPNAVTVAPAPIGGVPRMVYVVNRLLLIVAVLTFLAFVLSGFFAYAQHSTPGIIGCAVLCAIAVTTACLLVLGARRLRQGLTDHWLLHIGAVVLLAIPVSAIAFGIVVANSAKAPASVRQP